jgi:hypothetical protein
MTNIDKNLEAGMNPPLDTESPLQLDHRGGEKVPGEDRKDTSSGKELPGRADL